MNEQQQQQVRKEAKAVGRALADDLITIVMVVVNLLAIMLILYAAVKIFS